MKSINLTRTLLLIVITSWALGCLMMWFVCNLTNIKFPQKINFKTDLADSLKIDTLHSAITKLNQQD